MLLSAAALGVGLLLSKLYGLQGFLPVAVLLVISLVYLRYHYLVDVIAGIGLGILILWGVPKLESWWELLGKEGRVKAEPA